MNTTILIAVLAIALTVVSVVAVVLAVKLIKAHYQENLDHIYRDIETTGNVLQTQISELQADNFKAKS